MDRARQPLIVVLLCGLLAFTLFIAALAIKEWTLIEIFGIKMFSFGLWEYCVLEKCFSDVATVPTALTIVTASLILISLLATVAVIVGKRLSTAMSLLPVIFFFVAIIILFADIAVFWSELPQRSNTQALMTYPDVVGLNLSDVDFRNIISFKYGFSSVLLIISYPLLVVCLIASTFVAGVLMTKGIATNNHANVGYANRF